jgi:hypothetical protein
VPEHHATKAIAIFAIDDIVFPIVAAGRTIGDEGARAQKCEDRQREEETSY